MQQSSKEYHVHVKREGKLPLPPPPPSESLKEGRSRSGRGKSKQAENPVVAYSPPEGAHFRGRPVSLAAPTVRGDVYIHTYIHILYSEKACVALCTNIQRYNVHTYIQASCVLVINILAECIFV